ncbi:MAG: septum site-determining protein MinC [Anaerolineae bacterium]|nr:septum site-determining protein MinC [Anaerolineae bacterium]MDW8069336.1 septum site-determining protein MinC [Anaerolineae bacterium]
MEPDSIAIKGTRQGLLITLGEEPWEALVDALARRLEKGAAFFRGGRAALDVGSRSLDETRIRQVQDLLARYEVDLWAVRSTADATILATVRLGLTPLLGPEDAARRAQSRGETHPEAPTHPAGGLVVERTVRSGQRIEHPGDVIVIGDVHAGAEIIAGRHIIVWGKLHGVVHAGALGDESAVVCALDLAPTQLRIADHIARSPEERRRRPVPEMARVHKGRIEAIPWPHR